MSKKGLITLIAGYVAGSVIATVFSKKKGNDVKKELDKQDLTKEDKFKILLDNFVSTHENLLKSIKKELTTEENKAYFNEKKQEFLTLALEYKKEGEKILEDLKGKGVDALQSGREKIEELYEEKKQEIEDLKGEAPEKTKDLKNKLGAMFEDFKNKLK